MNNTKTFTRLDKPFLLIATDKEDNVSYCWLESEKELREVAKENKSYGDRIIDAIEIRSCRNVEI